MKKILLLLCLLTVTLQAQVRRDSASRIRFGDTLPATCNKDIGQVFFLIEPGSPVGLYQCLATDTWSTSMGTVTGTGASDQVAVFSGASEIGGSANLTFDGTNFDVAAGLSGFGSAVTTAIDAIDLSTAIRTTDGTNDSNAILFTVQTFGESSLTERDWKMYGDITTNRLSVDFQTNSGGYANLFGMGTLGQVFLGAGVAAGASRVALRLDQSALTGDGNANSNILELRGASFETATPHTIDWRQQVDLLDNLGDSQYIWSSGIDLAFTTRMTLSDSAELSLPLDTASIQLGASQDVQMYRGDGADILEQRRGANPQEWRLYDRFVSHSDYDRLTVYIGGGPPLKTIEFEAESTNAAQGISIDIEARPGGSSDGRLNLINGSAQLQLTPSSGTFNAAFAITSPGTNTLNLNGFLDIGEGVGTAGIGILMDIAGQGAASFEDSHSFDMVGAGENNNRAQWRTFIDVLDVNSNSIWTLQDSQNGGGFVDNFTITDDGGFNFPLPLPSHAIGGLIDTQYQLLLDGDYFSLLGADLVAAKLKLENRLTAPTGATTASYGVNLASNIRTQTATESVADIAQLNVEEPAITDQLTGGGVITQASTLRIGGAPTEGAANFALNIESGTALLGGSLEHTGTTVGFFSTTPATQPAAYTRNATIVEDRTLLASASATATNNNNVLAALIADLQSLGLIQ